MERGESSVQRPSAIGIRGQLYQVGGVYRVLNFFLPDLTWWVKRLF